jgi:histidinol-phosphate phosphatase family protein
MTFAIVIPTVGRASLSTLFDSLAGCQARIVVVDGRGRGPAAARNEGWRSLDTDWIVFLDDDVRVTQSWLPDLAHDLETAAADVAAVQGRITVPLPTGRRPTDWERNTAGLSSAQWITADIAYRRSALMQVGGFDERFPRAYREDADLALRIMAAGYRLTMGRRCTLHPVRPAGWWASVAQQRGNADDVLMRRIHGPDWRSRAEAPRGRWRAHVATTVLGLIAFVGRRRAALLGWTALTARFAWLRIKPGPRNPAEIARMITTSVVIPPVAVGHWLRGVVRHRNVNPRPAAVLVDRDGTIVRDVPYNGDPSRVEPLPGAAHALDRLRAAGVPIGVITNQSGVAQGRISAEQLAAVNARVEKLLGPFAVWQICPHAPDDGCDCRKPRPGLVVRAAAALGVPPARCVVIGDIGPDMSAARAAGATGMLVPGPATRAEEIAQAPSVYRSLDEAVDAVLGGRP